MTVTVILVLSSVAFTLWGDTGDLLAWAVNPDVLLWVIVANFVVLAIRAWSTTDAWTRAGGAALSVGLALLLLFVAVPHVAVGYVVWQGRSTIEDVVAAEPATATPAVATTTTSTAAPLASPLVPAMAVPEDTVAASKPPLGTDRVTILLLGGDAGPGRIGRRTDTMIVATLDTISGEAALFGLPRNMGGFEFSNGQVYTSSEQGLLNEVYRYGTWYPERFGGVDPGASAVIDVASHMLQLPIDHFVLVDLIGFAALIDAFGGVEIDVTRRMSAPVFNRDTGGHTNVVLEPGLQHMDGDLALAFARSRTGSSDYDRMGRQRCLLTTFADQLNPFSILFNFESILDAIGQNVTTDMTADELSSLMKLAPKISMDDTLVLGFEDDYRKGYTSKGLAKPDTEKIREAVELVITDPERARIELGIQAASEACEEEE